MGLGLLKWVEVRVLGASRERAGLGEWKYEFVE